MKIIDRLFVRLLTRLTLSRATRQGDLAADLAAAHGADLANTLADIDRLRRQLDIRIERVRAFVDDYSAEVKNLAQAEHMAMSLEAAADEWMEIQHDGANALVDYRDHDIADLKRQLEEASKTISLLRDNNAKQFNSGAAIAEELERFHAWALKLSGLQEKGNPSHATVREQVSKNFELLVATLNETVPKLAAKEAEIVRWRTGSEKLQGQMVEIADNLRGSEAENKNLRGLLSKAERIRDRLKAQARDFGADETQQTISTWAADTFGPCTLERAALRAVEEMVEFIEILQLQGLEFLSMAKVKKSSILHDFELYQKPQLMKEAADIVVCLYRVADLLGQDLHKEIDRVMQINRGRQWVRDGKGCGYHVKSPVVAGSYTEDVVVRDGEVVACRGCNGEGCNLCNQIRAYVPLRDTVGRVVRAMVTGGAIERVPDLGFTPRTEVSEVAPAFFDDETETLPASELAELTQREAALRMGVARLLGYECELSLTGVRKMVVDLDAYTDARKGWISFDIPNKANTKETVWGSVMSIMMVQGLEQSLVSAREEVGRWVRKFNNLGEELGFSKPMPHEDVFKRVKQLVDVERWEGLLRDSLERVLRVMFGAEVAARAIRDIGTDSFEATMQAVREKVEYAKAWCDAGGGSEIATARLKDRAEAMLLREKSVRTELRSIADRIRTGFAGGEHAAADAIERALADLP